MGYSNEQLTSPSSNGSPAIAEDNPEGVTPAQDRRMLGGLSDFISSHVNSVLRILDTDDREDEVSPRGVLDDDCSISPKSEGSSNASTSNSESQQCSKSHRWRSFLKSLKKGSTVRFHTFPIKSVPKLTRRKSRRIREEMVPELTAGLDMELYAFQPSSSWKNFSQFELEDATNTFSNDNLIGEGGCAKVYKGRLPNGDHVAIKCLTRGTPEEMAADFLSELGIIVHVDHPNIAKLIGYGVEGGMFLVLQLSPHGSLSSLLYGPREKLDWNIRYKIALGTAKGLAYLHEECQRRIIHKDIKAGNILLSEDFEPQISDFGLAKWLPEQWSHHILSHIEGTFGYLPPEYFMHGIVDEKTDVYAYGVLLLELITGRQALDSSQKSLVMWAKPLLNKDSLKEIIDPTLGDAYDSEQMDRLVQAASLCTHQSSLQRPEMSKITRILSGEEKCPELTHQRSKASLRRTYSEEFYSTEEYDAAKYLNDVDNYMQIVLGKSNEC